VLEVLLPVGLKELISFINDRIPRERLVAGRNKSIVITGFTHTEHGAGTAHGADA
jgi:hypothetical protein